MAQTPIYLDYNATTPIDPLVAAEMMPFLNRHFGNPSSAHSFGARTKLAVESARVQVAPPKPGEPFRESEGARPKASVWYAHAPGPAGSRCSFWARGFRPSGLVFWALARSYCI